MDIVLTDSRVSRRHARVRIDGARLLGGDLASSSGTAVNGVVIDEPTSLALGDQLVVGGTELTVVWTPTGSLPPRAHAPRTPGRGGALRRRRPRTGASGGGAPAARPALLLPIACLAAGGILRSRPLDAGARRPLGAPTASGTCIRRACARVAAHRRAPHGARRRALALERRRATIRRARPGSGRGHGGRGRTRGGPPVVPRRGRSAGVRTEAGAGAPRPGRASRSWPAPSRVGARDTWARPHPPTRRLLVLAGGRGAREPPRRRRLPADVDLGRRCRGGRPRRRRHRGRGVAHPPHGRRRVGMRPHRGRRRAPATRAVPCSSPRAPPRSPRRRPPSPPRRRSPFAPTGWRSASAWSWPGRRSPSSAPRSARGEVFRWASRRLGRSPHRGGPSPLRRRMTHNRRGSPLTDGRTCIWRLG